MKKIIVVISLNFVFSTALFCQEKLNVSVILKNMFEKKQGKSFYSKNLLFSCQYKEVQKKGKIKKTCSSYPRKKAFESIMLKVDKDGIDAKSISIINAPKSENGLKFMQRDYIDTNKNSDQWMFLPALKKVKRIVSDKNGPKTGSLFGSEISYEDIEKHHVSDFNSRFIRKEKIKGKNTWVIETIPKLHKLKKSSYAKAVHWIEQLSYLAIKSEFYDKAGLLKKVFLQKKIQKKEGIWLALETVVYSPQKKRMSMMKISSFLINHKFPENLISIRSLKDEEFFRKNMRKLKRK